MKSFWADINPVDTDIYGVLRFFENETKYNTGLNSAGQYDLLCTALITNKRY